MMLEPVVLSGVRDFSIHPELGAVESVNHQTVTLPELHLLRQFLARAILEHLHQLHPQEDHMFWVDLPAGKHPDQ